MKRAFKTNKLFICNKSTKSAIDVIKRAVTAIKRAI